MDSTRSTELLLQAQQSTGKRQKMYLTLLQLQILLDSGDNLRDDQRAVIQKVMEEVEGLVPEKRDPSHPTV